MVKLDSTLVVEQTKLLLLQITWVDKHLNLYQTQQFAPYFSRLIRWLDFFNQSFYRHHCVHYNFTIHSLFMLWFNGSLLHQQTTYEFDLSLKFYDSFFKKVKGSVLADVKTAAKLLVLSAIYAKYHGMLKKSLFQFFENHNGVINEEMIHQAIEIGFVKYETPHYLIENLDVMTAKEIDLLMQSLQGKNLRDNKLFPTPITRNQFARLASMSNIELLFRNQIILRGAILVKLTNEPVDYNLLQSFVTASDTFQRYPGRIWVDIAFWKKAYELISDGIHGAERCSVTDCVDFLEYMKYQQPEPFSLKGRTSNSLFRLVAEWHGYVHRLDFTEHRKEAWEKSKEKDLQFYCNDKLYQCKELHTGQMLYLEGQELSHCVITYTSAAKSGHCTIWSLREWDEQANKFEPIITIEVSHKRVLQALGYDNRTPTSEELAVIKDWTERMGYEVDLIKNQ